MGKRRTTDLRLGILVIAVILGTFIAAPYAIEFFGLGTGSVGWTPPPPGEGEFAPHTFVIAKEGTVTAVPDVAVYAWFDWDGDGEVDLGAFEGVSADGVLANGEIETLAAVATTAVVTTAVEYPIGEAVSYQCIIASYEIAVYQRTRSTLPSAYDGSALAVSNIYMRASPAGQLYASEDNTGNLISTVEYDGSAWGIEPTIDIKLVANTTDSGTLETSYYDWSNGKHYTGQFLGITVTDQDFLDMQPLGFDEHIVGSSNHFLIIWIGSHFDDDGVTGDSSFALASITMYLTGDCNMTVGQYSGILWESAMLGIWGSTYETNGVNSAVGAPVTIGFDFAG